MWAAAVEDIQVMSEHAEAGNGRRAFDGEAKERIGHLQSGIISPGGTRVSSLKSPY